MIIAAAAGCGKPSQKATGKMIVAASIAPLADFSRAVGGDLVKVELLVPPSASPHVYQPEPEQMKMLSKASVLVLNGVGVEFWADNVINAANNPKLVVVRTADGLDILNNADSHDKLGNPHVWLDPIDAIHQVEAIRDAFIKADPKHASDYKSNAEKYIAELNKLNADIRLQVGTFKYKSFIAFHPAWVYFAKRYGLKEAAVIEQSPGKEPSPDDIARVVDAVKKLQVKAIFAEPQLSPKAASVIAEEAGVKVLMLDPLGKPPRFNYIETMRSNLKTMAEAMK